MVPMENILKRRIKKINQSLGIGITAVLTVGLGIMGGTMLLILDSFSLRQSYLEKGDEGKADAQACAEFMRALVINLLIVMYFCYLYLSTMSIVADRYALALNQELQTFAQLQISQDLFQEPYAFDYHLDKLKASFSWLIYKTMVNGELIKSVGGSIIVGLLFTALPFVFSSD